MAVPLLDIKRETKPIRKEIDEAVARVIDHGQYILGPEVKQLEEKVSGFCGVKHAIGVASGTDALLLSLQACGVGPGDEVITSSFSFFASAGVISRLGAIPVFVDIDLDTYNIDPERIEKAISPKTKAILPIHLFGQCARMDTIMDIAGRHNIKVVEDAAQAIGSVYKERKAGNWGDAGCFSFFPTKNLGCAGDGGMVVTNDDDIADMVRLLRVHGGKFEYHHEIVGYNSRLDTLQAAILLVKLPHLTSWSEARRQNASVYDKSLKDIPIHIPKVEEGAGHIYNQYTIACDKRDDLAGWLKDKKIGCKIYYPVPFHLQKCFSNLNYKQGDIPNCEKAAQTVLSIPIFGEMTSHEQQEVVDSIKSFFN
ncbi:MAG: DegT/DnrJ/EryC1/StrS family aminotransferase [Candidatus Zixiibacteriota bacterium]